MTTTTTSNNNNAIIPPAPQQQQQQQQPRQVVIVRDTDVIMGRGQTVANHPGNRRFRHTIELLRPRYEAAARLIGHNNQKEAKTLIIAEIVALVKQSRGRFVKHNQATGTWFEVDDKTAKRKVGQALRRSLRLSASHQEEELAEGDGES